MTLCVCSIVLRQFFHARHQQILLTHDPTGLWTLQTAGSERPLSGRLVQLGYRSSCLLILTIQTEDGHLHRTPVWCDQVTGRKFSYLHQQLAFACEAPVRQGIWHRRPELKHSRN